ncbi:hypothetical protein M8C21_017141, partial [Ambrosia artemisiifolia]
MKECRCHIVSNWCFYVHDDWCLINIGVMDPCHWVDQNYMQSHGGKGGRISRDFSIMMAGFGSLAPKTKNLVVAGGLTGFVFGVYFYTMRAVGGSDELQVAIDKFESKKNEPDSNLAS